jgi:hypothetical protein
MFPSELWHFLPFGYLLTILIETPVLLIGLSRRHSIKRRLVAGVWLTACTYPIVVLVLPLVFANYSRALYLTIAEIFAPVANAFCSGWPMEPGRKSESDRCGGLCRGRFGEPGFVWGGEVLNAYSWFGLLS